jgi:plastocyanin
VAGKKKDAVMTRSIAGQSLFFPILTGILFTVVLLGPTALSAATPAQTVPVTMGDYRFTPDKITMQSGETVRLELTNSDSMTPHNFTLKDETAGLNVDIDVNAGKTEVVDIMPLVPGTYKFYCNKKLPFMKSHRKHGMEGTLVVAPAGPE